MIFGDVRVGGVLGHGARLASALHCEPGELNEPLAKFQTQADERRHKILKASTEARKQLDRWQETPFGMAVNMV